MIKRASEEEKFMSAGLQGWLYILAFVILLMAAFVLQGMSWQSDAHFHNILEVAATQMAFVVGILALVRFYSQKSSRFLFIGTGFMGTALFDGYHATITSVRFSEQLLSPVVEVAPWSWFVSRLFLSVLLWLSVVVPNKWVMFDKESKNEELTIYLVVSLLAFVFFVFFTRAPLPPAYYAEFLIPRPAELLPALFFGLAFVGYYRRGDWQHNAFERWLVLALVVNLGAQLFYMCFSLELYDSLFDAAHVVKILSYAIVFCGLANSMAILVQQVTHSEQALRETNRMLRGEIAERKRAGEALQASERRFRSVAHSANDAIVTLNNRGEITFWNPAAERILGYNKLEILSQPFRQLISEKELDYEDLVGKRIELLACHQNGREFPIELSMASWHNGADSFYTTTIRDITARRHQEEERQKFITKLEASNRELEDFAYVASHDLQEPLRKINAFGERLMSKYNEALDKRGQDYLRRMQNAASRMQTLINDLLSLSRITTRGQPFVETDLTLVMQEVLSDLEIAIEQSQGRIELEPLGIICADPLQMRQLFQNFISNALKFRQPEVEPVVKIYSSLSEASESDEASLMIMVEDNGIGFKEKYLDRIFHPFQRLHGRTKYEGTGIGLAICRKIIERHHGELTARSEPGVGATFIITLPVEQMKETVL